MAYNRTAVANGGRPVGELAEWEGLMRLLVVMILGGVLGWIGGSLYPAPQAWLKWINLSAITAHLNSVGGQTASVATPASAPSASATSALPAVVGAATPAPSTPAAAHASPHAAQGPADTQTLTQYRAWIHEARQSYPYADSEDRMYAVMMCESRGQAALVNPAGPYSGLFQYGTASWRGDWNTYRDQSVLDARAQIFATALAWQRHMQSQWGCYSHPQ
jgi:hypothetical protein